MLVCELQLLARASKELGALCCKRIVRMERERKGREGREGEKGKGGGQGQQVDVAVNTEGRVSAGLHTRCTTLDCDVSQLF